MTGSAGRGLYSLHQIVTATSQYTYGGSLDVTQGGSWSGVIASYREAALATSLSLTLSPFLDAVNNAAFGVFFRDVNASMDPDAGLFELADFGMSTPPMRLQAQHRTGQDLSVTSTDSGSNDGSNWLGVAAEFRASGGTADKAIVPSGVNGASAVTADVGVGEDKAITLPTSVGPFGLLFFFQKPAFITSRSVVTATVEATTGGAADKAVVPTAVLGTASVSAEVILGNLTIIPATINGSSSVTAVVTGPEPPIDFVPETRVAPALIPDIDLLPGPDTLPGSFAFRRLRED
jgi:hypothetical protein